MINTGQGPPEGCGKLPEGVRKLVYYRRGAIWQNRNLEGILSTENSKAHGLLKKMTTSVWHDWGLDMGRVEVNEPDNRRLQCPAKKAGVPSSYRSQ